MREPLNSMESNHALNYMVSIVIPTYNESLVIKELVEKIFFIFKKNKINGEVIIVDDASSDGTGEIAENLAEIYPVKVVHRKGKLGLSSAVLEGFKVAQGQILGVMDADLSHDPEIIPQMVGTISKEEAELAIGSRYIKEGRIKNWPASRKIISKAAILLALPLTRVKDITSGYFFIKKQCLLGVKLCPQGFKIGLEIFVKAKYKKFKEIPYTFTDRKAGESKFNFKEVLNYLKQLVNLACYKLSFLKNQTSEQIICINDKEAGKNA